MGQRFNHLYGEHFTLPEAVIDDSVALLPGLDGRKMSKSYDNTIPLFVPRAQLQKLIGGIVTDSRAPGEPKDTEGSAIFQIYRAFATEEETQALRAAFADGIGWGDAKQLLFERVDREVAPMRARYQALIDDPAQIEATLLAGAARARAMARPFMDRLRHAVGLRNLTDRPVAPASANVSGKTVAKPAFKQYRERADGLFYFKLVDGKGALLLQSRGFASYQEAAQAIALLEREPAAALSQLVTNLEPVDNAAALEAVAALQVLTETTSTGD